MNDKQMFAKYRRKLVFEGVLKSFVFALTLGAALCAVAGTLCWFLGANGLWWCIGALGATIAIVTPVLYFVKFRPDERDIAGRIDALGLDERMLTRLELKGDHSTIARLQSEDAVRAAGKLSVAIKLAMPLALIICAAVCVLLGAGATTVSTLSAGGYIPTFKEAVTDKNSHEYRYENFVSVRYVVINADEEGNVYYNEDNTVIEGDVGFIDGDVDQIVELGGNASPVSADPDPEDEGWGFAGWYCFDAGELTLDNEDPFRFDENISLDHALELEDEEYRVVFYYALYVPIVRGEGEGGEGEGDEGEGEEGDSPSDGEPSEPAEPSEGSMDSDPNKDDQGENGDGAGGSYNPNGPENQIIDGKTNYHEVVLEYTEEATDELESLEDLPDEYKDFIEQYLKTLN